MRAGSGLQKGQVKRSIHSIRERLCTMPVRGRGSVLSHSAEISHGAAHPVYIQVLAATLDHHPEPAFNAPGSGGEKGRIT